MNLLSMFCKLKNMVWKLGIRMTSLLFSVKRSMLLRSLSLSFLRLRRKTRTLLRLFLRCRANFLARKVKKRVALIDADLLVYRIGFAYENESSEQLVKWQVDVTIEGILNDIQADEYECFITSNDKTNFRFAIDAKYKANRVQPKPKWYNVIRSHLVDKQGAEVVEGMEADDRIGIRSSDLVLLGREEPVIVS